MDRSPSAALTRLPVLILGGADNALAIARSLTRYRVPVHVSAYAKDSIRWSLCYQRGFFPPRGVRLESYWESLLLRDKTTEGSILLTCSDEAVEFVAHHHAELGSAYVLEENRSDLQLAMLDKHRTLVLAERAGVSVPWHRLALEVSSEDLQALRYPLLVKPLHSHRYQRVFRSKLRLANSQQELASHLRDADSAGLPVMLCEFIPGEDDQLCSYYTYVDRSGQCLFPFTKRIVRRAPKHFGMGCYHMTQWLPDVAAEGRKFLLGIGYRGLANVEFKRDPRDGKLKLIECNPRFTAPQQLLVDSGVDTAKIVYDILSGGTPTVPAAFAEHKRLLYPLDDLAECLRRRARGEMSLLDWWCSVAHRHTLPRFQWRDPLPALVSLTRWGIDHARRRLG